MTHFLVQLLPWPTGQRDVFWLCEQQVALLCWNPRATGPISPHLFPATKWHPRSSWAIALKIQPFKSILSSQEDAKEHTSASICLLKRFPANASQQMCRVRPSCALSFLDVRSHERAEDHSIQSLFTWASSLIKGVFLFQRCSSAKQWCRIQDALAVTRVLKQSSFHGQNKFDSILGKGSAHHAGHFLFLLQSKHNANAKLMLTVCLKHTRTKTGQPSSFSAGTVQCFVFNLTRLCCFPNRNRSFWCFELTK